VKLLAAIAERRTAILGAAGTLLLDQISKDLAVTLLVGEAPVLLGPLALTYTRNPGAAMGAFGSLPESLRLPVVLGLTGLVLLFLLPLVAIRVRPGRARQFGVALVIGGAFGNLIDRVRHGAVVDFLTLHPGLSERFPVFNLADVAVVVGACLLLLYLRRDDLRPGAAVLGLFAPVCFSGG
jgi:signal peptidase II